MGLMATRPRALLRSARTATPAATTRFALLTNAASLIGTFGVTSLLGMAFWLIAARYCSRSVIGVTGGLISAMVLLGQLCTLGFGTMLIGELPRRRNPSRALISSAMAVSGAAGMVGGLIFVGAAPAISSHYQTLTADLGTAVIFAVGVALTASSVVFDGAAIGVLRGGLQLWRNGVFAAAKLVALIVFVAVASNGAALLLGAWIAGVALSLLFVFIRAHQRTVPLSLYHPQLASLKGLWKDALGHQAFNVSFNVPVLALPILVLGVASAAANAGFYLALQIAGALYVVPTALTTVLFATGTLDPTTLAARIRLTLKLSIAASGCGVLGAILGGGQLLGFFGSSYAGQGSLLVILALASVPLTAKSHFLAITRIEQRVAKRLPLVWFGACSEIGAGAGGAVIGGANGAAVGWLIALCAEAAVMSPVVWKALVDGAAQDDRGSRNGSAALSKGN